MNNIELHKNAEHLFLKGEYSQAVKIYESIPDIIENCDTIHDYGICLVRLEKYDEAIEVFSKIVKKYPDYGQGFYSLGRTYLIKGDLQQAIDCFSYAKNIIGSDSDVYFYSALCYERIKNYDKAIEDYKASLELNNSFQTHINLGLCYYDIGDIEVALSHLKEAFNINSKRLDALRYYVYILIKTNKRAEAFDILLNTDLNYDEDATTLELFVLLALNCKNFDTADKAYLKLKKAEEGNSEPFDYERFRKIACDNSGDVFEVV